MKRRAGKILGVAIGQKSILLAEVTSKGETAAASHLAEFVYPEGISLEKPAELGKALAGFLKTERFSCREAVIGLPAKRLVTRKKDVPPAQPQVAAGMLRIQAEGEFSSEPDGLIMDYAGKTSSTEPRSVLLIAATRQNVTQCEEFAKAAGLKLRGVTATASALARATADLPGGGDLVVSIASGSGEMTVQHEESPTILRHLNIPDAAAADPLAGLSAEIRRTIASINRNGTPLSLALWSDKRTTPSEGLQEKLNMPVTPQDLRSLVTTEGAADSGMFAPAVAVGLSGLDIDGLPVNFLDSRLQPPPPATNRRKIMWLSTVGGAIVLLVLAALVDLHLLKSKLQAETDHFNSIAVNYAAAQTESDHFKTVLNWSTHKPRITACLRDLTNLFPDNGDTVWATTISLHATDMSGEITGKASLEQQAQRLRESIEAAGNGKLFAGTKRYEWHGSTGRNGESTGDGTFIINFTYHGTE